ncbi:MAG: tetratricopeptide repeat protein [Elusimicrobia bacterium]|nr:tetratricopeptide repeat protein [Elusimicrobiota bacterium]
MAKDLDNYEKLKAMPSEEEADRLIERLQKAKVSTKKKKDEESGYFEVWVAYNDMFTALGISAEFDSELKRHEAVRKSAEAQPKKAGVPVKAVLVAVIIGILAFVGYQFNKTLMTLSSISSEVKPIPIKVDLVELKKDFKSLIEDGKIMYSRKTKFKFSFNSMIFKWNLTSAKKAYEKGRYSLAAQKLEKCLKKDPENRAIISLLLRTYIDMKTLDSAEGLLKASYGLPSSDYRWKRWVTLQLADVYMMKESYYSAEEGLKELLDANPDDTLVLKKLSEVNSASGNLSDAAAYLQKVKVIDPNDTASRLRLGELLVRLKMYGEAYDEFSQVYENINNPARFKEISLVIARIRLDMGMPEQAREYLDNAIDEGELSEGYLYARAVYNYVEGNYDAAGEDFGTLTARNASFVPAKLYLNLILINEGETEKAAGNMESLSGECRSDDELALMYYCRASLDAAAGRYDSAWDNLVSAYQIDRYTVRRFDKDPAIRSLKGTKKYSAELRKLR